MWRLRPYIYDSAGQCLPSLVLIWRVPRALTWIIHRLGIGKGSKFTPTMTWRISNITLTYFWCFSLQDRLTCQWVHRCWSRSTPPAELRSVSVISSLLLQDIRRHDTRLFEVGRRLNPLCCLVYMHAQFFSAYYIAKKKSPQKVTCPGSCHSPSYCKHRNIGKNGAPPPPLYRHHVIRYILLCSHAL